ncbi:hypothetical protein ACTQ2W_09130 [Ligilactobacillus ruminis]|uniref:hypothetical protein n=1 Tax=Ligilactobacillus ruminis TaxID=1623 RepID=UPI003F998613
MSDAVRMAAIVAGHQVVWQWLNSDADYGQNAAFWDMPVKCGPQLRANGRFLKYARKTQSSVTGKWAIFGICP